MADVVVRVVAAVVVVCDVVAVAAVPVEQTQRKAQLEVQAKRPDLVLSRPTIGTQGLIVQTIH